MVNQVQQVATALGGLGRYGDTYMVHATEGETIVPMLVLNQSPILKKRLFRQMRKMGINPERYIVGNQLNSINPITGQPEFFLKKIFKEAKKAIKRIMPGESERLLPLLAAMIPGIGPWATAGIGAGIGALTDDNWKRGALQGALLGTGGRYLTSAPGQFAAGRSPSLANIIPRLQGIPAALQQAGTGEGWLAKTGRTFNPWSEGSTLFGGAGPREGFKKWGPAAGGILGALAMASGRGDKRRPGSLIDYDVSKDPLINLISGNQEYVDWLRALGLPIADQDIYQEEGIGLGAQGGFVQAYDNGGDVEKSFNPADYKEGYLMLMNNLYPDTDREIHAQEYDNWFRGSPDSEYFEDRKNRLLKFLSNLPGGGAGYESAEEHWRSSYPEQFDEEGNYIGKKANGGFVQNYTHGSGPYGVAPPGGPHQTERQVASGPDEGAGQFTYPMLQGGIIQGYQAGGFPRQTGAISGPGTGTSDSVPAMLSDGEFVMTADAVRNAGGGNRRAGAQNMYNLMNRLEGGMV